MTDLLGRLVRAVDAETAARATKAAAYTEYKAGRIARHVLTKSSMEHLHTKRVLDETMAAARKVAE